MRTFETIDDLKAWLEPLGYDAFWRAMFAHGLLDQDDKAHCDHTIQSGTADFETVLTVTKWLVRMELTDTLGLQPRTTPSKPLQLTVVD